MNDDMQGDRRSADDSVMARDAFDSTLSRAFADVPLPPGLLERLTVALAKEIDAEPIHSAPVIPASSVAAYARDPADAPAAADEILSSQTSRRRWLSAVGGTLAASIAGGLWLWQHRSSRNELSFEELLDEVLAYSHEHPATNVTLRRAVAEPPPVDLEIVRQAVQLPADLTWWRLEDRLAGRLGIALELAQPAEPRAVLFLLDRPSGNPTLPQMAAEPMRHPKTTGGCAVEAWRSAHHTALLVVEGDEARYLQFLQLPRMFA